jgi:hypothetical protein
VPAVFVVLERLRGRRAPAVAPTIDDRPLPGAYEPAARRAPAPLEVP